MNAETLAQTLRLQTGYVAYTCMVNLDGVTDEDALVGPDEAVPLSEMIADLATTTDPLQHALDGMTDELLAGEAPIKPTGNEDETMGSLLAGLAFHEAYHAGQLGVLRRVSGREGAIK